jgi:hypothetical protein
MTGAAKLPDASPADQPGIVRLTDGLGAGAEAPCTCRRCVREADIRWNGFPLDMTMMIVCSVCGDKRCVHAKDHRAPCAKADIYAHNTWVERNLLFAPPEAPNV